MRRYCLKKGLSLDEMALEAKNLHFKKKIFFLASVVKRKIVSTKYLCTYSLSDFKHVCQKKQTKKKQFQSATLHKNQIEFHWKILPNTEK